MINGMKRKFIVASLLLAGWMGVISAPGAQAANYVRVKELKAFTPPANYMSLPGYVRWRFFLDNGRWISRAEADGAVRDQGASAMLPTRDWKRAARQCAQRPLTPQRDQWLQRGF
jgi:hypothetical protein